MRTVLYRYAVVDETNSRVFANWKTMNQAEQWARSNLEGAKWWVATYNVIPRLQR